MFTSLRIRGSVATILWGYRPAVKLRSWSIKMADGQWTLTAAVERVDAFGARQTPLLFTAPREGAHDGMWCWGVDAILSVGPDHLMARLGPPEQ